MKTAKLTNFKTDEVGTLIQLLGGRRVLYCDKPITTFKEVTAVREELRAGDVDSVFFDQGALQSKSACKFAKLVVANEDLKVLIFNFPKNGV